MYKMELLDIYLRAEHGYNRFILYTLFPKVWLDFLGEESWGARHIIQDNYEYLKENRHGYHAPTVGNF